MNNIKIFSGTSNISLAQDIAKYIKKPLGDIQISKFKDGETYIRIKENIRGKDVFIIQPTSPPVNENLMELAIVIDALRRASAIRITAVIPYYGYARQDRKARSRESITAKLVATLLTAAGVDRVLTLDLHADQIQGFFDIPLDHLKATPLFVHYIKKMNLGNIVAVSPDAGSSRKARSLARMLDAPLVIIDKRREEANKVAEVRVIGDVKGKNCVIVDDMIDTAGTVTEGAKALMNNGAKGVYIYATHGVLSDPAFKRLSYNGIKEVVVTDTISNKKLPKKIKTVSVAPLLGEAIIRIHNEQSISSLYEEAFKNKKLTKW